MQGVTSRSRDGNTEGSGALVCRTRTRRYAVNQSFSPPLWGAYQLQWTNLSQSAQAFRSEFRFPAAAPLGARRAQQTELRAGALLEFSLQKENRKQRILTCMALVGAEVCTAHEGPLSCRENMSGASSVHPSGVHSASPVAFREGAGAAIIDGASGRSAGSRPRCARGSILAWEVQRQQAQRRNTKHSCMSSSKRLKLRKKQEQQNARAHAAGSPMSHEPSNVAQQWCERACQDLVCMHPDG